MLNALIDDYMQMPLFAHLFLPALLAFGQFVSLLELSRLDGRARAGASVIADIMFGLLSAVVIVGNWRSLTSAGETGGVFAALALLFLTLPALAPAAFSVLALPLDANHLITGRTTLRRSAASAGSMRATRSITVRPTLAGIRRNGGHR